MNESERVPKKCLLGQLDGTRPRGRLMARYIKLIEKDLIGPNRKIPNHRLEDLYL
jgi:hypothetical protein